MDAPCTLSEHVQGLGESLFQVFGVIIDSVQTIYENITSKTSEYEWIPLASRDRINKDDVKE
jgi:hypothetical protein